MNRAYLYAERANKKCKILSRLYCCFQDYKDARERKERNKALIMQMHPSAFAIGGGSHGSHYASTGRGSGFI